MCNITHYTYPDHLYVAVTTPTAWFKFRGEINDVINESLKNVIYSADPAFLLQTQTIVSSVLYTHSFATSTFM